MKATQRQPSILDLLKRHGIETKGTGAKRQLRCPLPDHKDSHPSAAIFLELDRFYCSVCTPGRTLSADELAAELGFPREPEITSGERAVSSKTFREKTLFSPEEAAYLWSTAFSRARDDQFAGQPEDQKVYRYLEARGISEALEHGAIGILVPSMDLPESVRSWTKRGYQLVAPLYSVETREIVNVQGRSVLPGASPKTLFPPGSVSRGTVFATVDGLRIIQGEAPEVPVVLAEGLTDHLALTIHSPLPVLSAPGAGIAIHAVKTWVRDRDLILLLDCDPAGNAAAMAVTSRAYRLGARSVRRIEWPQGGKDACETLERLGMRDFNEFLRDRFLEGERVMTLQI